MSAPMSDAFLVVAQTPAGPTCFFLPRWLPDGSLNAIRIQRLKDKLGNKANASSEVEFIDAMAWRVGDEGRGLPQILAMGALTRLDCSLGTAGLMRGALSLALHHATHRQAFGKRLADHALMRNVLADLALESEAATAFALRLARAVDRSEDTSTPAAEREHEALMRRLLTPAAKYWICKRGSHFAQEAMECLGGNGYVEGEGEGVMARIYREMPLNSIWEGAGNIMALDLLRALRPRRRRDRPRDARRQGRAPAARSRDPAPAGARAGRRRRDRCAPLRARPRARHAGRAAGADRARAGVRRVLREPPRRRPRRVRAARRHHRFRRHPPARRGALKHRLERGNA
jgi:putative acyl-CoA dehydrogenase